MSGSPRSGAAARPAPDTLLTPEVLAWVGRTEILRAPEPLGPASIRYFALAIGSDPDRWLHEAPPTLICETAQLGGRSVPDEHGYLGHVWSIPFPRPMLMIRGGNDYRFERPVRPDDLVVTTWTIVDITERTDRAGSVMAVVTSRGIYETDDGEALATNTETLLYRPVAGPGAGPGPR